MNQALVLQGNLGQNPLDVDPVSARIKAMLPRELAEQVNLSAILTSHVFSECLGLFEQSKVMDHAS